MNESLKMQSFRHAVFCVAPALLLFCSMPVNAIAMDDQSEALDKLSAALAAQPSTLSGTAEFAVVKDTQDSSNSSTSHSEFSVQTMFKGQDFKSQVVPAPKNPATDNASYIYLYSASRGSVIYHPDQKQAEIRSGADGRYAWKPGIDNRFQTFQSINGKAISEKISRLKPLKYVNIASQGNTIEISWHTNSAEDPHPVFESEKEQIVLEMQDGTLLLKQWNMDLRYKDGTFSTFAYKATWEKQQGHWYIKEASNETLDHCVEDDGKRLATPIERKTSIKTTLQSFIADTPPDSTFSIDSLNMLKNTFVLDYNTGLSYLYKTDNLENIDIFQAVDDAALRRDGKSITVLVPSANITASAAPARLPRAVGLFIGGGAGILAALLTIWTLMARRRNRSRHS